MKYPLPTPEPLLPWVSRLTDARIDLGALSTPCMEMHGLGMTTVMMPCSRLTVTVGTKPRPMPCEPQP